MLIVETGAGLTNANAYIDVAFADTYHDDRKNELWDCAQTDEKESAIIKATDYIDRRWCFIGFKQNTDQSLEWPRADVFDRSFKQIVGIFLKLQQATAEYALRALDDSLAPDLTKTASGGQVTEDLLTVGPITIKKGFNAGSGTDPIKDFPLADFLLSEFVIGNGAGTLIRG